MTDAEYACLTESEIDEAMALGSKHKGAFGAAARAVMDDAIARDIPDHVLRSAIICESLLLAAHMHSGDEESFVTMAARAIAAARDAT